MIDIWFEETVKAYCKGEVKLFRYCDDLCICCENESDARRIYAALIKRLARYKLTLNQEKTQLVSFSRHGQARKAFDFLGFTFYWGKSRKGARIPKVKTSGKRMRAKLKRVNQWARETKDKYPLAIIWQKLRVKLQGHIQYYGVSFNLKRVNSFLHPVKEIIFKWLNRRSQKKSFDWEKYHRFIQANPLPRVTVCQALF